MAFLTIFPRVTSPTTTSHPGRQGREGRMPFSGAGVLPALAANLATLTSLEVLDTMRWEFRKLDTKLSAIQNERRDREKRREAARRRRNRLIREMRTMTHDQRRKARESLTRPNTDKLEESDTTSSATSSSCSGKSESDEDEENPGTYERTRKRRFLIEFINNFSSIMLLRFPVKTHGMYF